MEDALTHHIYFVTKRYRFKTRDRLVWYWGQTTKPTARQRSSSYIETCMFEPCTKLQAKTYEGVFRCQRCWVAELFDAYSVMGNGYCRIISPRIGLALDEREEIGKEVPMPFMSLWFQQAFEIAMGIRPMRIETRFFKDLKREWKQVPSQAKATHRTNVGLIRAPPAPRSS